jgi:hypothetical protein
VTPRPTSSPAPRRASTSSSWTTETWSAEKRQPTTPDARRPTTKSFNERWSVGDNRGYLDSYAEEVSYFDPVLKKLVVGRDKAIAHIDSNPHIVRSEYLNPAVSVAARSPAA